VTTAVAGGKPSMLRRTAAAVALAALVAALVYVAVSAVSRWYVLLASVVSLGVTVIAVWYILSRRGVTRALAGFVAALALLVFAAVVIASESIIVLVVGLALAAVSVGATSYALSPAPAANAAERAPHAQHPVRLDRAPKAQHPVLLMNLKSGGGKAERFRLVDRCRERGIEPVVLHPGDDLRQLAQDAVARGADLLGMAGGDGSQALVASVASRHRIPFVVVPAGTRNHFALDLGLDRDDVPGALDAYEDGVDTKVDLAEVNGRVFVNNASMGVYAKIVQSGDYRDAKLQTAAAMLPDLLGPEATPLDLRFTLPSGEEAVTAQLLLVSNNPYQLARLRGGGTRERLDSGVLGIAFARVDTAVEAEKLAALEAAGRVQRFASWSEWTTSEFDVQSSGPVEIGVDGEAMTLQPPLHFVTRPGALTIRLPRTATGQSPAMRAIRVMTMPTVVALWQTFLGHPIGTR
jgi:diacylglycerol kinase family enzyme